MKRTNYIGRRNEKIVIIKETREKEGNAVLVGKCDCGKERTFSATQIKKVKSCLECRVKYDQTKEFECLLGQKINNFTVEKKLSSNGGKLQWLCRCDCDEMFKLSTTKIINGKIKHCPKCSTKIRVNNRTNDISGQTFNYLKVLRRGPNKSTRVAFYCKCLLCNKDEEFLVTSNAITRGKIKHCGCKGRPKGKDNAHFLGYEKISGTYLSRIKHQADSRGLKVEISPEYLWKLYLSQNGKCALSGVDINFDDKTASLDRICSLKDYIEDNLQWIHKDLNVMKLDFSQEEFIHKCKLVADFNPAFLPILDDKDGINQSFFCLMRNSANQREIPFEITKRDVWDQFCRQGGICALSGIPLKLPSYTESIEDKASLDRIDSAKRIYNLENVQFVHKDINLMKWKFDQDYFIDWCKKVAAHAA